MEQLNNIISEYIANLSKDYKTGESTGNATAELSFRPALDGFFVEIMEFIIHKTKCTRISKRKGHFLKTKRPFLFHI